MKPQRRDRKTGLFLLMLSKVGILMSAAAHWLKRRKVVVLLIVFSFIMSGLIVNLLELFTLPLLLVSKRWFRIVNARLVYLHWSVLPWAMQRWANYDIRVFAKKEVADQYVNKEHALCVLNHRGDLDWMIGWCLIDRMGMLGGVKAIMKDVAKFLPGIGWTFVFMEYPFVKRDWKKDEDRLIASCKNLSDYPVNMLLCLFPEGSRFTDEKHKRSVEFARSQNLREFKHHLFPRKKGFCCTVQHLKDSVPAIYDITTCCRDGEPSIMGVLNAEPCSVDVLVRRFPMSELPTDSDEALADWLIKLFREKDELVEYHNKHKTFPEEEFNLPTRLLPDVVVLTWLLLLGVPVFVGGLYLAWVGAWSTLLLTILVVVSADQLFQYIVRETVVSKSSSEYGRGNSDKKEQ